MWRMMFKADLSRMEKYQADLIRLNKKGLPYATLKTINTLAFDGRGEWQKEIDSSFVLRNKYTRNSIRVNKARGNDIGAQKAVLGSIAAYMGKQESGGQIRGKGKSKQIATKAARTGGSHARIVSRRFKFGFNDQFKGKVKFTRPGKNEKQKNAIQIRRARKSGSGFAYLKFGKTKGIFLIKGDSKDSGSITMLHDMTRGSVRVDKKPTMHRAVARTMTRAPRIYVRALIYQLKKLKTYSK